LWDTITGAVTGIFKSKEQKEAEKAMGEELVDTAKSMGVDVNKLDDYNHMKLINIFPLFLKVLLISMICILYFLSS